MVSERTQADNREAGSKYLHGYSSAEQERLFRQAEFLEPYIFEKIDYAGAEKILEVGCGVGAQTAILLRRFPAAQITAIDYEPSQIGRANRFLTPHRREGRVRIELADATLLPYREEQFDGAFLCWVLEHVSDPSRVLQEVHRTLRPGGKIYVTEVLNAPLVVSPECPAILHYWNGYNQHQKDLGGDPFIGARLPNLLLDAGFELAAAHPLCYAGDRRLSPEAQRRFYEYWQSLFLSAAPSLLAAKRIEDRVVETMKKEFEALKADREAIFFLVAMQVLGTKKR